MVFICTWCHLKFQSSLASHIHFTIFSSPLLFTAALSNSFVIFFVCACVCITVSVCDLHLKYRGLHDYFGFWVLISSKICGGVLRRCFLIFKARAKFIKDLFSDFVFLFFHRSIDILYLSICCIHPSFGQISYCYCNQFSQVWCIIGYIVGIFYL